MFYEEWPSNIKIFLFIGLLKFFCLEFCFLRKYCNDFTVRVTSYCDFQVPQVLLSSQALEDCLLYSPIGYGVEKAPKYIGSELNESRQIPAVVANPLRGVPSFYASFAMEEKFS